MGCFRSSVISNISHFGEGRFRYAGKTLSNHHKFRNATYVLKRYKTPALANIEISKQSLEIHSRNVNTLARNLVPRCSDGCAAVTEDFSKTVYNKVFFGKIQL